MPRYDYGYRGRGDVMPPRYSGQFPRYADEYPPRGRKRPPNRVVARYNMDYVREQGDRYPINYNRFGADWPGQLVGEDEYSVPYITRGGTNTNRGAARPMRYDYREYGPDYGGRYPDEL